MTFIGIELKMYLSTFVEDEAQLCEVVGKAIDRGSRGCAGENREVVHEDSEE